MEDNEMETNTTTGLHVSFSIEGKKSPDDYDFFKMMILFDENYTAGLFNRINTSQYVRQMRDRLHGALQDADPNAVFQSRYIDRVIAAFRQIGKSMLANLGGESNLGRSKYYSFRHRSNGVIEFRSMGGEDYQQRFEDIRKRIINMAYIMKVGSDETLLRREYITRIYQMLTSPKFSTPSLRKQPQFQVPYGLNTFDKFLKQERPQEPFNAILQYYDFTQMTPVQARQLRMVIAKQKLKPAEIRSIVDDDERYNQLASKLRFPLVVPTDPGQQTMPYSWAGEVDEPSHNRRATDYGNEDEDPDAPGTIEHWRQERLDQIRNQRGRPAMDLPYRYPPENSRPLMAVQRRRRSRSTPTT
jgi:hypothetical protein